MINSQAESGQKEWNKLLVTSMRAYVRDHPEQFKGGGVGGVAVEQAAADSDDEVVRDEGGCSDLDSLMKDSSHWNTASAIQMSQRRAPPVMAPILVR
jgi:hypothetical protein